MNKNLSVYWAAFTATCNYLRNHHPQNNYLGYNPTHPLAIAITEMWMYEFGRA